MSDLLQSEPICALTKPLDAEADKPASCYWHAILVVAERDPRLSWPERELIRQLGVKLYGDLPEGGR